MPKRKSPYPLSSFFKKHPSLREDISVWRIKDRSPRRSVQTNVPTKNRRGWKFRSVGAILRRGTLVRVRGKGLGRLLEIWPDGKISVELTHTLGKTTRLGVSTPEYLKLKSPTSRIQIFDAQLVIPAKVLDLGPHLRARPVGKK